MKKLIVSFLLTFMPVAALCAKTSAVVTEGEDGRFYATIVPGTANSRVMIPSAMPAANAVIEANNTGPDSVLDTGSLPPLKSPGYIYYTVPIGALGSLNLVTPWSAAILAEGYDFVGEEAITQGFVPLFSFWKVTGVIGGGINGRGEGSPMGGAIINLVNANLGPAADFNVALTGGYNLNAGHALAVLSGSVQFLK